ncbi:MAG TPA: hypothetical protein VGV37_07460 [Aliidongia sp.]|uniref:endonuclease toxin domain-containing protein n=1 Tax=Aliidongia sp. TaxID=1914230 RepID=UPI002DDDAAA1|nr:hypothetical protein [Aliidongia sp.]HEV2674363.1 hypothetical protein [Aliidongia sp.]
MHAVAPRCFKLDKGFGLDCSPDGVTLAGVPLLRRTIRGFVPRDDLELRCLLERAYGLAVDTDRVTRGIDTIARALNEHEPARAMIRTLLLGLPELDGPGAARLAQADDALTKFDPGEPRDDRGRWAAANGNDLAPARSHHGLPPKLSRPPLQLVGTGPANAHDDASDDEEHWVTLPPGQRVEELGDLLEWVANAKPDETPTIRQQIRELYYDRGDTRGGDALNLALSDALEATTDAERTDILERFEPYTREDPALAAADASALALGVTLFPRLLRGPTTVPEAIPPGAGKVRPIYDPKFWDEHTAVERGLLLHGARSSRLASNFPVIDNELDGLVTSTKTIDLRVSGYQSESGLRSLLNQYIRKLANFNGKTWGGVTITAQQIKSRELDLIIPRGVITKIQRDVILAAKERALSRGVRLRVTQF